MKARADNFAKRNWVRASTSLGLVLRPAHWFGSRKPLPSIQEGTSVHGSAQQLPLVKTDPFGPLYDLITFTLFICLVFGIGAQGIAEGYRVDGKLVIKMNEDGTGLKTLPQVNFSVQVSNCMWRISVEETGNRVVHANASFDGKQKFGWGGQSPVANRSMSTTREPVPFYGPIPHLPIVWLGAASGCYFRENPSTMPPPYSAEAPRTPLKIEFSQIIGASVPSNVTFFNTDGITNGSFHVESFHSVGDLRIPKEFTLIVFAYDTSTKNSSAVLMECTGETQLAAFDFALDYRPKVTTSVMTRDYRFLPDGAKYQSPFIYSTNRVLEMSEVSNLPGFSNYAVSAQLLKDFTPIKITKNDVSTVSRRWVLLALAAVTIMGLGGLFLIGKKSHQQASATNEKKKGKS